MTRSMTRDASYDSEKTTAGKAPEERSLVPTMYQPKETNGYNNNTNG